jgi:hypothetical protein
MLPYQMRHIRQELPTHPFCDGCLFLTGYMVVQAAQMGHFGSKDVLFLVSGLVISGSAAFGWMKEYGRQHVQSRHVHPT